MSVSQNTDILYLYIFIQEKIQFQKLGDIKINFKYLGGSYQTYRAPTI